MHTLQIGDEWHTERAGGLNSYFFELIRHLEGTGTKVFGLVVGTNKINDSSAGRVNAFSQSDSVLANRMLSLRRVALREISEQKIDLIASHFALYAMPIIDRLHTIPTVIHFHGPWAAESGFEGASDYKSWLKRRLERSVYTRATRLIVLSYAFRKVLIENYGISEDRVRVVPGGIDAKRFNTVLSRIEARQQLGWPTDRPIVLTVRRQVRRMGLEALIDAAKLLALRHPDILILLGGTGPLANDLQRCILEQGVEENVRCLGRIRDEDLPLAYRAADFTVVPSQSLEGFGLITLESLASGTPVFVTPIGGLPEIVEPFAPQCIFADTSVAEMANVLGEALRGERSIPSDQACRNYSLQNYSWPQIAGRVRLVYDEAIS